MLPSSPEVTVTGRTQLPCLENMKSSCHKQAVEVMITLLASTIDIGSMLSQENANQRDKNRTMLLKIISTLCFVARRGLALRGDGSEDDGNFIQLLKLNCGEGTIVTEWLSIGDPINIPPTKFRMKS